MSTVKNDQVLAIPLQMQKAAERHPFRLITDGDIQPQDVAQTSETISSTIDEELKLDVGHLLDIFQKDPNTTITRTFNHKITGFSGLVKEVVANVASAVRVAVSGSTPSLIEKVDAALVEVFTNLAAQAESDHIFFSSHGSSTTYRYLLLVLARSAQSPLRMGALMAFEITVDKKKEDVLKLTLSDKAKYDAHVLGPVWNTLLV